MIRNAPILAPKAIRKSVTATAAIVVAAGLLYAPAASAAPASVNVTIDEVGDDRPANGGWWVDEDAGKTGMLSMAHDSFDGSAAAKLYLPSTSAKAYLYHDYPAADRPTDLLAVLAGSSYTFTGVNVNFQVEMVFLPNDVATYGAQGTTPCTSALDWGLSSDPDACYTVMKWEPFSQPTSWLTVDLTQDVAADSPTGTAGWISQKRLGQYAGPGVFIGQKLSTYLAEIDALEITSMVFGAGSGTPGPTAGWVRDVTFDGVTYTFAPVPAPPAPAPAADSGGLDDLIVDEGIDVDAATDSFQSSDGDLSNLNPNAPLNGTLPWSGSDTFVDVYAYSTPVFLGSFAVIAGNVVLSNLNLSNLPAGAHRLVIQGQSSGALAVLRLNIAASGLANGGSQGVLLPLGGAALMLLAGAALVLRERRALAR